MISEYNQCTLNSEVSLSGQGLHSGAECSITLHPGEPDTGIVFVTERGEVRARAENVCDTRRGTSLANGDARVSTVEHLLAAFAGMRVDNARVEVRGPEIPIGDGSALPFVEMIERAGTEAQSAARSEVNLTGPIWTNDSDKYLLAVRSEGLTVRLLILFAHPMIGEQAVSLSVTPEVFKREIAPARTFCTYEEVEPILKQGLGLGGREDNVVICYDDHYSVPLRYVNEFARHKLLDLIGDLSLIGGRLHADVTAIKPSHTLNVRLADKIAHVVASSKQGG
jgi:UDP-3-O-[3-hydroxymyristoyl] N-acetylglucosamine deacetylase